MPLLHFENCFNSRIPPQEVKPLAQQQGPSGNTCTPATHARTCTDRWMLALGRQTHRPTCAGPPAHSPARLYVRAHAGTQARTRAHARTHARSHKHACKLCIYSGYTRPGAWDKPTVLAVGKAVANGYGATLRCWPRHRLGYTLVAAMFSMPRDSCNA